MARTGFHSELVDATWKFCALALFQLGMQAGLSLVSEDDGFTDIGQLAFLVLPIAVAILVGRTASRPLAAGLLALLAARLAWQGFDLDNADAILYVSQLTDALLVLLAVALLRQCWIIARRDEVRYGRIVTKMLGRLA